MVDQHLTRRTLLAVAGVSTVSVAGCLGDDDDGDQVDEDGDEETGDDGSGDGEMADDIAAQAGEGVDISQDGDFELPVDPSPEDFADRTGEGEVEIETVWREEQEPEFVFDHPFVLVEKGTTVRWINGDGVFHSVTATESLENRSQSGAFNEQIAAEGATFEWEAAETGRQNYFCTPHAGFMYGAVEVI